MSAYTHLNGKTFKVWSAKVIDGSDDYEPGCIYHIGKNDMYVQTGKGALSLVEVQLQGKKRMDTGSFLRGCHVEEARSSHYSYSL